MIVRQLAINGYEQAKQSGSKSKPTSQTYSITIFQSRNKPLQDQQALWIHHKCPSCKKQGHTKMRSPRAENGRAEGQEEQKQLTSVAYQGWRATTFCSAKVLWARNLKALSNEQIQPMSTGRSKAQALVKDKEIGMHPTVKELKMASLCAFVQVYFLPLEIWRVNATEQGAPTFTPIRRFPSLFSLQQQKRKIKRYLETEHPINKKCLQESKKTG